jgi:hypothetical protein
MLRSEQASCGIKHYRDNSSQAQWYMPVVLATREAKPKESLEKSSRPASISSQKKKKNPNAKAYFIMK